MNNEEFVHRFLDDYPGVLNTFFVENVCDNL